MLLLSWYAIGKFTDEMVYSVIFIVTSECYFTRSAGDGSDDKLMNLPSFLDAFSSIISQLSQV